MRPSGGFRPTGEVCGGWCLPFLTNNDEDAPDGEQEERRGEVSSTTGGVGSAASGVDMAAARNEGIGTWSWTGGKVSLAVAEGKHDWSREKNWDEVSSGPPRRHILPANYLDSQTSQLTRTL